MSAIYIIHAATLKAVAELRELQIMRERDAWLKDTGKCPAKLMDRKNIAALSFRNGGEPITEVFPVALMAKWARLVGAPELQIKFTDKGDLFLGFGFDGQRWRSQITVKPSLCTAGVNLSAIISLSAPDGGEFRLDACADPAEAVKAEKKRMRDAVKRESIQRKAGAARAVARSIAKSARQAVAEHRKAQALWRKAGAYSVAAAKRLRSARRLVRSTLASPQTLPGWLSCDERKRIEAVKTNIDGCRAALAAYKPTMRFDKWHCYAAKRRGMTPAKYAAKLNAEKPWPNGQDTLPKATHGPKYDELCLAVKDRERRLRDLLGYAVARHLGSLGIHDASFLVIGYGPRRTPLSEARRVIHRWPSRRRELADQFNAAWREFRQIAASLRA